MRSIEVSAERKYEITFNASWAHRLSEITEGRSFVVITPEVLVDQVTEFIDRSSIIVTPNGETQKSLETYTEILNQLSARKTQRNALVIGIGGGATTDLAGFIAATYLRGLDWIAVPATVAGMVDASIGGKTGLNLAAGKNLVGSFHSPVEVIIDMTWLKTLPERDVKAGLAESIKCGFIKDPQILKLFQAGYESNLSEIIHRSVQVKAEVVSKDFKESYEREALNYGHTLGHAIEKDSNYELRHGEAISIGMVFAAELARALGGLTGQEVDLHREIITKLGLPVAYQATAWGSLIKFMESDKKRFGKQIRFVTLNGIGRTDRKEIDTSMLEKIYLEKIGR